MKKLTTHFPWYPGLLISSRKGWHLAALLLGILSFNQFALAQKVVWDKTLGGTNEENFKAGQPTRDGGYILGGFSRSDKSGDKSEDYRGGLNQYNIPNPDFWIVKLNANGSKAWDKTFGGTGADVLTALQQTPDGGYILGGYSESGKSGDKSEASKGDNDYWVVKISSSGTKEWDKTFGGESSDVLVSIDITKDGGYILGGTSDSGKSGDKSENGKNSQAAFFLGDYWVVKLNTDGSKAWDKTIGGEDGDLLSSLQQTTDGGYILGGYSHSSIGGDKTEANRGATDYPDTDYWVVKLNKNGTKEWDKTFGGTSTEVLNTLQQTADNGYLLGGYSKSKKNGDKSEPSLNSYDYWVVKTDAQGTKEWDTTVGGTMADNLQSLLQTSDGSYILGGYSSSGISGVKSEENKGERSADYWIVKLNAAGKFIADKTVGSLEEDVLATLHQTPDGNLLLGGYSFGNKGGDKSENNKGVSDFWIVKIEDAFKKGQTITFESIYNQVVGSPAVLLQAKASSDLPVTYEVLSGPAIIKDNKLTVFATGQVRVAVYQKGNEVFKPAEKVQSFIATLSGKQGDWTYGGSKADTLATMIPTPDGGYLLGGTSNSGQTNDKSQANRGSSDYWVAKINKNGQKVWDKTFGGTKADKLAAIVATPDGGYLLGGSSASGQTGEKSQASKGKTDYWLVKIDEAGNKLWDKTYGGSGSDNLAALLVTSQGYLLGGSSNSDAGGDKSQASKGKTDYWILGIDFTGNKLWDQTYGGSQDDQLAALLASPEGGFLLGGSSASGTSGDKSQPSRSNVDYWVVRINEQGTKLWDKTYGGKKGLRFGDTRNYEAGYSYLSTLTATPDGGYLVGGSSSAAKGFEKSEDTADHFFEIADYWVLKVNSQGEKVWDNAYGSVTSWTEIDFTPVIGSSRLSAVVPLPEGGYLLAGTSQSYRGRDKSEENRRNTLATTQKFPTTLEEKYALWNDFWILKIDEQGKKLEDRTLGSDKNDKLVAAALTPEGNFMLAGYSEAGSNNDKSPDIKGATDYWLVQVSGRKVTEPTTSAWELQYGDQEKDNLTSVVKTKDGGYLAAGYSNSSIVGSGGPIYGGKNNYWIVKTDRNGFLKWQKAYGGLQDDYLNHAIQTQDGGYLLAGSSLSGKDGTKTQASQGGRDYWIIKIDKQGQQQWEKTIGGSQDDELKKVIQLTSGEYVLAGYSDSPTGGDKTQGSQGNTDYWLVKISKNGTKIWDKRYGGTNQEKLGSFTETADGGFLLVGSSLSGKSGDKTETSQGSTDYWIVKTDKNGNLLWDKTYGGNRYDEAYSVAPSGNDFLISGTSSSDKSGSKSQNSQGGKDYWLVKVDGSGKKLWDKTYGGSQDDELRASSRNNAGDLVLAGFSESDKSGDKSQSSRGNSDYWMVQVDAAGNQVYDKRFGGNGTDELRAVLHTNDGGLLLGGTSDSNSSGEHSRSSFGATDYWLVKVAPETLPMAATRQEIIATADKRKPDLAVLLAYPNPFSEKVTINLTLPETQTTTVRILDGQGKEVAVLFQQEAQANQTYQIEWQAGKQEAGLYLLQLQTLKGQNTQKLLLSK